jgi:Haem-binding domain
MKILRISAAVLTTAFVVVSLVPGPYASATQVAPGTAILQTAQLDPASNATIQRACANCHSYETQWPWYGHVAPVSWLMRKDVSDGRAFLNFSRWAAYGAAGQSQLLSSAVEQINSRTMPPRRYLLLHPGANVNDSDRLALVEALRRESCRISEAAPETSCGNSMNRD